MDQKIKLWELQNVGHASNIWINGFLNKHHKFPMRTSHFPPCQQQLHEI